MPEKYQTITIRELARATKKVLEDKLPCVITNHGRKVAVILPYDPNDGIQVQDLPTPGEGADRSVVPEDVQPPKEGVLASF